MSVKKVLPSSGGGLKKIKFMMTVRARWSFIILKSPYICVVKTRRIVSICLIYTVLVSIGYGEPSSQKFSSPEDQSDLGSKTHLIVKGLEAQVTSHEIFKISIEEKAKSGGNFICHKNASSNLKALSSIQQNRHLQADISKNSSKKLFIDFGALII